MKPHSLTSRGVTALAFLLACLLAGCNGPAGTHDDPSWPSAPAANAGRLAIERHVIPAVTIMDDEFDQSIEARLDAYHVPAVSIAIVRNGEIAWAGAYGADVDATSQFQAASLSKAVAAAGILALARERGFDIDADLTGQLGEFDIAAINPDGPPVTLRALLSHTAGATVHGFAGYPVGVPVPDTLEIITGSERTNSPPVTFAFDAESPWRYSGGGVLIAQLWAEQISGEDFAELMQRLVLDPVGMSSSSFALNWPDTVAGGNVARAHGWVGDPIEGGWRVHPEQAAAGLWTTPSDYARFLIALMAAADGERDRGIAPDIAREMTTAPDSGYGLGIGTGTQSGERYLTHSGGNEGYQCNQIALPDRRDAIIVMTNGNGGDGLIADINRTARIAYDWPHEEPRSVQRYNVSAEALAGFAGRYAALGDDRAVLQLEAGDRDLHGIFYGRIHFLLVPIETARFIDPVDGEEFSFALEDGVLVARAEPNAFARLPDPDQTHTSRSD